LADGGTRQPSVRSPIARHAAGAAIAAAAAAAILLLFRARVPVVEPWRVERTTVQPVPAGRGTILPPEPVAVFPEVIGRVVKVLVAVGDRVRPGDPLVELDGKAYAAQVDEARAAVAHAEREAQRAAEAVDAAARRLSQARGLAGKKIASPEYLQSVKLEAQGAAREQEAASAALDAARSKLASARETLARTRVA
jgi:multidrug efflux pump subunit AcrA (membrane-fusion protein)